MKKLKLTRLIPVIIILICISADNAGAQGIDINARNKKGLFLGLNISPVKTSIINKGTGSLSGLESSPSTSISSNLELGYSLSKNFGISTGVGFIIYKSTFELGTYNTSYDTTDSETENYKRYISGSGITEEQKITFLVIPINLNIDIPVSEKFGFYIKPGMNFLIHLNSAYDNSGTFDYSGYYSKYNVTISDVPFEGFETDARNIGSGEPVINSFNLEISASGGAELNMSKSLRLILGIDYRKILTPVSGYETSSSFRLTSMPGKMNSVMAGSEDVSASAFGISLGIRYFIK